MTGFRIDVYRKSGTVMLWMETRCGFRPIIGWESEHGVREFAQMLLGFCNRGEEGGSRVREISDRLLRQALGHEEYSEGGLE